ncbi:MAG TPA: penicillin-binding transpeptidase domain-containing protein, partial [Candidatus Dojkabacteria bacterium]|nr:penicillin-binding transpeptidase domain-containing protein [Candidatus Dojkabacteria bacterium]
QPISAKTAEIVTQNMVGVIKAGEAHRIFSVGIPNYDVAGKTGTAQIPLPNRAGYYTDRTNATFVGFSPTKNAKMIMLVRLEQPGINTFSASTAVPVWINIFKAVADDLGIPKN